MKELNGIVLKHLCDRRIALDDSAYPYEGDDFDVLFSARHRFVAEALLYCGSSSSSNGVSEHS